jgi:hypothetical protein
LQRTRCAGDKRASSAGAVISVSPLSSARQTTETQKNWPTQSFALVSPTLLKNRATMNLNWLTSPVVWTVIVLLMSSLGIYRELF